MTNPLTFLLCHAVQAALDAGKAILNVYHRPIKVQYKDDHSPLTEADQAAHEIITKVLRKETPDTPILSEEGRDIPYEERRLWKRFWLVDPLDGTKEFIKRNGEFTVNIALIEEGRPVLGVIYVPCLDHLYFACQGVGSFKIDQCAQLQVAFSVGMLLDIGNPLPLAQNHSPVTRPLQDAKFCSSSRKAKNLTTDIYRIFRGLNFEPDAEIGQKGELCKGLDTIRVVGSRSHGSEAFEKYIQSLKSKHKSVEITPAGSSLKFCLVAEGKADIYPRLGPTMEWDTGAGQAICEQVGCQVFAEDTKETLSYNKKKLKNPFFICSAVVHQCH